ncbi:MAG: hypothetical protein AAFZ01_09435, partial [Pseudomonadota bacterium]
MTRKLFDTFKARSAGAKHTITMGRAQRIAAILAIFMAFQIAPATLATAEQHSKRAKAAAALSRIDALYSEQRYRDAYQLALDHLRKAEKGGVIHPPDTAAIHRFAGAALLELKQPNEAARHLGDALHICKLNKLDVTTCEAPSLALTARLHKALAQPQRVTNALNREREIYLGHIRTHFSDALRVSEKMALEHLRQIEKWTLCRSILSFLLRCAGRNRAA